MDNEADVGVNHHSDPFRLITRGLALLSLILALDDLISLPPDLLAVFHYWQSLRVAMSAGKYLPDHVYFFRYYMTWTCGRVIVLTALAYLAGWFYRGGPGLRRFFGEAETLV